MKKRIYLDHNASTPLDPSVLDVVTHYLHKQGNPSSYHSFGQEARNALVRSRQIISSYLQVKPNEIVFTSGGTEGANLLLRGLMPGHLITSSIEHSAVYATAKCFDQVTFLEPGLYGAVQPDAVLAAIRPDTRCIALMAVNNETGVKTDIAAIAEIAFERKIPFIVDGVALLGKEVFTIPKGVSGMFFSGHKCHAPQGIGFAFMRSGVPFKPFFTGGEQQFGKRGGTENMPGIVGLGKAVEILKEALPEASLRMNALRERFESSVKQAYPQVIVNGEGPRTVNVSNLCFPGVDGESLLMALDLEGVAVSHGSACASGALEPSRILLNMGISRELARSSLRFSFSRMTTEQEIDAAVAILLAKLPS